MTREQMELVLGMLMVNVEDAVRHHDAIVRKEHDPKVLREAREQFDQSEREAVDRAIKAINSIMKEAGYDLDL